MRTKLNIKLWLFILAAAIVGTGLTIYFTYKKIAYNKDKVETYLVYNYDYAYYYNNKTWQVIKDMSFVKDIDYKVYNDNNFFGIYTANIDKQRRNLYYIDGSKDYYNLIGINSNKNILMREYNYENLMEEDIDFSKQYLASRDQTYFEGQTSIKLLKMDINADVIFEKIYIIRYESNDLCYAYFVIKYKSNTETVLSYANDNSNYFTSKTYKLGLIIDADLNEKKEILIIENGYEYSKLLLYANQYGTYSLVE